MKYKIVVDSSSDLKNDYIVDENVGFEVAPLTIHIGDKHFIDNENINVKEMLECINNGCKSTTSCPNPNDYLKCFNDAENIFCVTISSKLSGSYNSALIASRLVEDKNVLVIDSKLVSGNIIRIVDELYRLIKEGLEFEEIKDRILKFRDNEKLFFVLDKYDNLINSGRLSKTIAVIASLLKIKPLCYGEDGEIKILHKVRTRRLVINTLIDVVIKEAKEKKSDHCIITHCLDDETGLYIKEHLEEAGVFKKVTLLPMHGLCSYYALEKGIIVSL